MSATLRWPTGTKGNGPQPITDHVHSSCSLSPLPEGRHGRPLGLGVAQSVALVTGEPLPQRNPPWDHGDDTPVINRPGDRPCRPSSGPGNYLAPVLSCALFRPHTYVITFEREAKKNRFNKFAVLLSMVSLLTASQKKSGSM